MKREETIQKVRKIKKELREYSELQRIAMGRLCAILEDQCNEYDTLMNATLFTIREIRQETPEYLDSDNFLAEIRDMDRYLVKAKEECRQLIRTLMKGDTHQYWVGCSMSTLIEEYEDFRKDGFTAYDTENWEEPDDLPIAHQEI